MPTNAAYCNGAVVGPNHLNLGANLSSPASRKARIAEIPKGVLHFKTASTLLDDETVIATAALANSRVSARSSCWKAKSRLRRSAGQRRCVRQRRLWAHARHA